MSFALGAASSAINLLSSLQKPAGKKPVNPFAVANNATASNSVASPPPLSSASTSGAPSGKLVQLTPETLLAAQGEQADRSKPQQSPQEAWDAFYKNIQAILKDSPNKNLILGTATSTQEAQPPALASQTVSITA